MNRYLTTVSLLLIGALSFAQSDALRYGSLIEAGNQAMLDREYEDAVESFSQAIKIAPWDGSLFAKLARAEGRLGNTEQAVAAYKEAIRLGSVTAKHRANYEYQIALLYAAADNADKCYQWLEQSVNHGLRSINQAQSRRFRLLYGREDYKALVKKVDTDGMSREEGMLTDLQFLDREVRRVHYAPYRITPKEELDYVFEQLEKDIPNLNDEQFYVRMRQYMKLFGDGHTSLSLGNWKAMTDSTKYLPVTFYWFSDGIHVLGAQPGYEKYIGYQVVEVEGRPISEIAVLVDTVLGQDNPQGGTTGVPILLGNDQIMRGLGIIRDGDVTLKLQPGGGKAVELKLGFQTPETNYVHAYQRPGVTLPLYVQHWSDKRYWYKVIPEQSALYMQYNSVREDSNLPMADFMAEVMTKIEELDIQKLIIDVRFNGGGNSFLNANILKPVMRSERINKKGHLFVITGRRTFSAAQNFASDLMRDSDAIFVGEPTGSAPQFVGETVTSYLPYTKMRISVSDLFWQRGWSMDHRIWIPPDLPAPLSVKDYMNNHDPALQAALDYQVKK